MYSSESLKGIWDMINTMQILSRLTLLSLSFPANYQLFMNIIQGVSSFELLPSRDLIDYTLPFSDKDELEALNSNFEEMDIFCYYTISLYFSS